MILRISNTINFTHVLSILAADFPTKDLSGN